MTRVISPLCALLATALLPLAAIASPVYDLSVIDAPNNGYSTTVRAMNNTGGVVGYAQSRNSSPWGAFVSQDGVPRYLGPNVENSQATDINDNGTVIGNLTFFSGYVRAVRFTGDTWVELAPGAFTSSEAAAINARGQTVGRTNTEERSTMHAFLNDGGKVTDLGTLGGSESGATDINDSGVIVGWSDTSTTVFRRHAFVYTDGVMTDIGTLGGAISYAAAINEAGVITGYAADSRNVNQAFIYADGKMVSIGTLGSNSQAFDINDAGQVVGAFNVGYDTSSAFLYTGGQTVDLNSLIDPALGWTLQSATAINDKGEITAFGCKVNGPCTSLYLTQADPDNPANVPEPEAFTAGLAGLALFGWMRRRKRAR